MAALNAETSPVRFSVVGNFGSAIKGKRTLASLHDAVDTELAAAKIAADKTALLIRTNLAYLKQFADYTGLFADISTLALKDGDDFQAVVNNRISAEKIRIAEREAEVAQAAVQAAVKVTVQETIVSAPVYQAPPATPKYSEQPGPTLSEIASILAFDRGVDVNTARSWIVRAVNTEFQPAQKVAA